jgi:hypothetical protein
MELREWFATFLSVQVPAAGGFSRGSTMESGDSSREMVAEELGLWAQGYSPGAEWLPGRGNSISKEKEGCL